MKHLRSGMPGLLALAAACLIASPAMAQTPGGARAQAPDAVPELPASDLLLRYEGPELHFRWSLAPEATLEPALVQSLRTEALTTRERAIREAQAGQQAQKDSGRDTPLQYEWIESWEPEAETDLLLAFSAEEYSFTGGAHGNLALKAVIWDRGAGRRIGFDELFADARAMQAVLKPQFCRALDDERRRRRGGQLGDSFTECPDPAAYPTVPVGDGEIHAIRVLVPPYEAGPWAEGSYEILLDTSTVLPFLQQRYRLAFTSP